MLSQTFHLFVIEGVYALNKEDIISNKCENRDKPKLNCLGRCFMAKKLKEKDNEEKKVPGIQKEKFEIQIQRIPDLHATPVHLSILRIKYFLRAERVITSDFSSFFRPPKV